MKCRMLLTGDLTSLIWTPVQWELIVQEASDDEHSALIAVCGVCMATTINVIYGLI